MITSLRSCLARAAHVAVLAGAVAACSGVAPRTPAPLPTAAEAVALVQRVRGLQAKRPIQIEWVDEAELRARAQAQAERRLAHDRKQNPSELRGLVDHEDRTNFERARAEAVGGFYDPVADRIVVPRPATEATRTEVLALLAHEIEHAIVEQHFPTSEAPLSGTVDGQLAWMAMLEGDAHATMGAVVADDEGVPIDRGLLGLASDARLHGLSIALGDHGSRLQADHAAFAYLRGLEFIADLHRTGGFALVDRAFREPPVSTAQILEPQRFLDGDLPVPIAHLADESVKETSALGAKRMSDLLHRCKLELSRPNAAVGWDGDRLSLLDNGALVLVTTWRTPADAQRFEASAGSLAACLVSGRKVAIERHESHVVVVAADGPPRALLASGFASIGKPPPERPLAELRIPPRPARASRGIVQNGVFRSDWLGLRFTLPPKAQASMNVQGLELQLKSPDYVAWFSLYKRPANAAGMSRTLTELEGEVRKDMSLDLLPYADEREQTSLGLAYRRTYRVARSSSRAVIEIIPICRGNGAIVLVLSAAERADEALVMEHWRTAQLTTGSPPVCSGLDLP